MAPIVQIVVVVSLALVQTGLTAVSHEVGSYVLGPKIGEGHRVFDEDCVLFSLGHQGARPAVGQLVDFDRTPGLNFTGVGVCCCVGSAKSKGVVNRLGKNPFNSGLLYIQVSYNFEMVN